MVSRVMQSFSLCARRGYKLAKAIRLTSLLTQKCVDKLTDNVTNIHDCLKTYMLKTCLIVLHLRDPSLKQRGDELFPEQWALLLYEQLLEFLCNGELPILLDCTLGDDEASVVRCRHFLPFIWLHEHLRAACCDNKLNVLALTLNLHDVLTNYCISNEIKCLSTCDLPPYNHNDHLL